jgi:hypothetical protein
MVAKGDRVSERMSCGERPRWCKARMSWGRPAAKV